MTYSDAIKGGFRIVNRNWQLVVVQAVMMIVNCIGFFVVVGIPLGIAFVVFGLDLTGLADMHDVIGIFRDPSALLSKYMGLVLLILTSLLIYISVVTTAGIFVFAGSAGIIGHGVTDPPLKFSMKRFLAEGRRLFFPLTWFSLLMGLVFLVIAFLLGLLGGGVAIVVQAAKSQDSTLALFLGIFFSLVLALISVSIIVVAIALTVYGLAVLFFKGESSVRSFRDAAAFLWNRQDAFWLYVILFMAYLAISFILMLFTYPFILIPVLGTIISFPLQLVSSYIGLAILSTIFIYYFESEIRPSEIPIGKTAAPSDGPPAEGSSSGPEDTSAEATPAQGDVQPQTDPTEEV